MPHSAFCRLAQSAALGLCLVSVPALAQSTGTGGMAMDGREHPGSPKTGWTGNISPADPYSAGPDMGAWVTKTMMIHSRSEIAVGEVGGRMYVIGGYADGNVAQPLNEEYDPVKNVWYARAPMPQGANHIAAVGLGGKLYAIGGFTGQNYDATDAVFAYDPKTDKWSTLAPLPQKLGSMAAVAVDGKIHAIGGAGGHMLPDRHSLSVHYIYDPATNKWSTSTPLPFPREHFGLVYLSGKLYAVGGRIDNFSQNTQTIFSLDLGKPDAKWVSLPLMKNPRSGSQVVVLKGKIFVFGGEQFGGVSNESSMFDPVTMRWSDLTPMPLGRHGTGGAVIGDTIYIPGGGPLNGGAAQTNANQAFTYP